VIYKCEPGVSFSLMAVFSSANDRGFFSHLVYNVRLRAFLPKKVYDVGEKRLLAPEVIAQTVEKVEIICKHLKTA